LARCKIRAADTLRRARAYHVDTIRRGHPEPPQLRH